MPRRAVSLDERLHAQIDVRSNQECWPWRNTCKEGTHPRIRVDATSSQVPVARLIIARHLGLDMTLDWYTVHFCKNKLCCNPYHIGVALSTGPRTMNRRKWCNQHRDDDQWEMVQEPQANDD